MAKKKTSPRRMTRKPVAHRAPAPAAVPPLAPPPVAAPQVTPAGPQMKSIWFMVGLVLVSMGALIFLTGAYLLVDPSSKSTTMSHLQPDLWWGAVMVVAGLIFFLTNRKTKID